jgi:hypothetical protein
MMLRAVKISDIKNNQEDIRMWNDEICNNLTKFRMKVSRETGLVTISGLLAVSKNVFTNDNWYILNPDEVAHLLSERQDFVKFCSENMYIPRNEWFFDYFRKNFNPDDKDNICCVGMENIEEKREILNCMLQRKRYMGGGYDCLNFDDAMMLFVECLKETYYYNIAGETDKYSYKIGRSTHDIVFPPNCSYSYQKSEKPLYQFSFKNPGKDTFCFLVTYEDALVRTFEVCYEILQSEDYTKKKVQFTDDDDVDFHTFVCKLFKLTYTQMVEVLREKRTHKCSCSNTIEKTKEEIPREKTLSKKEKEKLKKQKAKEANKLREQEKKDKAKLAEQQAKQFEKQQKERERKRIETARKKKLALLKK